MNIQAIAKRDIADLLPHSSPMILVDEVVEVGEKHLIARVDMSKQSLFSLPDGRVPSYTGMEYMAQTIGVLTGIHRLQNGQDVKIGFLLGTRKYHCSQTYFPAGKDLLIKVEENIRDSELGVFDCSIYGDELIASAQIKAIQPENVEDILGGTH